MSYIEGKRIIWIDYARVFAIICVVICHAAETYYRPILLGQAQTGFIQWFLLNFLFMAGRLGVPLFLGITGVLMLGKEWEPFSFYKKYLIPMIVTTEIWIFINYIFQWKVQKEGFFPGRLLREMLFLKDPGLSHMWYMPMIIGIYVIIPFLSKLLMSFQDNKSFLIPGMLAVFTFVLIPTVEVFRKEAFSGVSLNPQTDVKFLGGIYGLYLIFGYMIGRRKILKRIHTGCFLAAGIAAMSLNIVGQYFLYSHQYYASTKLTWYTSAGIFVCAVCAFELIRRNRWEIPKKAVRWTAKCSFGIYLLHKPLQILLVKYLPMDSLPLIFQTGILFFVSLALSVIILLPVSKYGKGMGKWIFLIK